MREFEDRVVVITGAAGGIGMATAKAFAEEGAKLVLVDISNEQLEIAKKELGLKEDRLLTVAANVSKEQEVQKFVKAAVDTFGKIDVLFQNAGVAVLGALKDTDESTLDKVWGVNMKGPFFGMKTVIPIMEKQRKGVIINTGSIDSYNTDPMYSVYDASKHGLLAMSKCAALEEAQYGIRINVVCPWAVNTGMLTSTAKDYHHENPQKVIDEVSAKNPMGRIAEPEDIANAVLFLASDKSSFINATRLAVDGGFKHM